MWTTPLHAQEVSPDLALYRQLQNFELSGESATVENLVIEKDRARITFTRGTFYFEKPTDGAVHGAVFIGTGQIHADAPNSLFERQHLQRMLNATSVDSSFETAVLRFSDETLASLPAAGPAGPVNSSAQELAADLNKVLMSEAGLNLSARMLVSLLNAENPGLFFARFDKGRLGRFAFVFDPQGRIPNDTFGINGGEKGLFFGPKLNWSEVWMAFYGLDDYARGVAPYSDAFDIVAPVHNDVSVDVRNPGQMLRVEARLDLSSRFDGVRAIPFRLNPSLYYDRGLWEKHALKLKSARLADGTPLTVVQEELEGGLTVALPAALKAGERFSVVIEVESNFMLEHPLIRGFYYPIETIDWLPHHGYLRRSTFNLKFLHSRVNRVVSIGVRTREEPVPNSNEMTTEWVMNDPVSFATFAVGEFQLYQDKAAGTDLPVEFYSPRNFPLKEDFVTAEIGNALNYFTETFGKYPYTRIAAAFHPRAFGQGFPSLLMIPNADDATSGTFSFIAHEAAHQWWGHVVSWRSYRDQWLSEGFAEYSGMLYTRLRDGADSQMRLIGRARSVLNNPPETLVGIGEGKLNDVGPIVLGHRLESRETGGAYSTLIYSKGALVLRMLHMLFTDPATGNGQAFFDMMKDFVEKHRGGAATNDAFREVANQHFVGTPIAMKYQLKDLNWFFSEWTYQAVLPSYRMEYRVEDAGNGTFFLSYTLFQENAPQDWLMILPLRLQFGTTGTSVTTVHALGPQTTGRIRLPSRPSSVALDPELWVLSERTNTREVN